MQTQAVFGPDQILLLEPQFEEVTLVMAAVVSRYRAVQLLLSLFLDEGAKKTRAEGPPAVFSSRVILYKFTT